MDQSELDLGEIETSEEAERISFASLLITQGEHKLYTVSMPSDVLAETCMVDTASGNPEEGFQRNLDQRRAREIADYIDKDLGTIPGAIVLSAQRDASLKYDGKKRTISFKKHPRSFFILDGQHRVFGFRLATAHLRVPVVIYNDLSKREEVRIFSDINTKQRPIPGELLLHIKRLAETEEDWETLLRKIFDLFNKESDSPLLGLLSATEKQPSKISRVTFNSALKPIYATISGSEPEYAYSILGPYLHAWIAGLREAKAENNLVNPTLFKAIILLWPVVGQRIHDRRENAYTADNYRDLLAPFFARVKRSQLLTPGKGHRELFKQFTEVFQAGFSFGSKGQK